MRQIDGNKIDDLTPSQEDELRQLLAHTGDDGVEAVNKMDGDTVDRLLRMRPSCGRGPVSGFARGGSCLDEETLDQFRKSVATASTKSDLTDRELDTVIRRVDNLEGEERQQAIRFIAKTDAEGAEIFSDLSTDGLRKLLSITYRGKIDGDASIVDNNLDHQDMIAISRKGTIEDTMVAIKKENGGPAWQNGDEVWLEEGLDSKEAAKLGRKPAGWKHLLEEHEGQFVDEPFISKKGDIKGVIYETVKKGNTHKIPDGDGGGTAYVHRFEGRPVTVIVGDNGYIVTARPGTP